MEKTMNEKQRILTALTEILNRWLILLASLGDDQITSPLHPSEWTVKDIIAHLWAWQQISVARMEAALYDREPEFPEWWHRFGPDPEEQVDRVNAWIYMTNKSKPWMTIYSDWKAQFQLYLDLTRQVPEKDLLEAGRYSWMGKYTLSDRCMVSLGHHEEHFDSLHAWLNEHGESNGT